MKKRTNYYHFENEIMAQLQGHYLYYKDKNRIVEKEIILLLAESIEHAQKFLLPSNYELYLPKLKIEYGFSRKKEQNDWVTEFKKQGISYLVLSTKNPEIINRVQLLGRIEYDNITRIEWMFFKYKTEWFFPTHVMVESESNRKIVQILNNKRINQEELKLFIKSIKKINKDVALLVQNNKIEHFKKNDNQQKIVYIPKIFKTDTIPKYSDNALIKLRKNQEYKSKLLQKILSKVIKN